MNYRTNVIWTLFGKSFFLGSQFFLIMFLSKYTDMNTLGAYSLGLAITGPIFLLTNLQLRVLLVTEAEPIKFFSTYFILRIILSFIGFIIVAIICSVSGYDTDVMYIILLCALIKINDSIADIFYGAMHGKSRMDLIAKSQILRGVSNILIFITIYFIFKNIYISFFAGILVSVLITFLFDVKQVNKLDKANVIWTDFFWKKRKKNNVQVSGNSQGYSKKVLLNGLPLGIIVMIGSLSANVPSYVIETKISLEAVGIFASLVYLIQSTSTFMSALWEPAIPKLTKSRDQNDYKKFTLIVIRLSAAGFFIGLCGFVFVYFFGEYILALFFNPFFVDNSDVFLILSGVLIVRYLGGVWSIAATVLKYYWVQVPLNILNLILVLLGSIFLVEHYGLIGAAYALLISTCLTRVLFLMILIVGIKNLKSKQYLQLNKKRHLV
jgi:O-antigen/teichoic acid export membrane protein